MWWCIFNLQYFWPPFFTFLSKPALYHGCLILLYSSYIPATVHFLENKSFPPDISFNIIQQTVVQQTLWTQHGGSVSTVRLFEFRFAILENQKLFQFGMHDNSVAYMTAKMLLHLQVGSNQLAACYPRTLRPQDSGIYTDQDVTGKGHKLNSLLLLVQQSTCPGTNPTVLIPWIWWSFSGKTKASAQNQSRQSMFFCPMSVQSGPHLQSPVLACKH